MASALTMTGVPSVPQIITGSSGGVYTVIDSLPEPEDWKESPQNYFHGAIVKHNGKFWVADDGIVNGSEPGVTDWTELNWRLAAHYGRVAAKITIQNAGTEPILISEGRSQPVADAYHFSLPAATAADDGTGGFTQWDDFRQGCIRISSVTGSWRAAIKIIWRNSPAH